MVGWTTNEVVDMVVVGVSSGLSGWREVGWVSVFIFLEDGSCVREIAFWFPSVFG